MRVLRQGTKILHEGVSTIQDGINTGIDIANDGITTGIDVITDGVNDIDTWMQDHADDLHM